MSNKISWISNDHIKELVSVIIPSYNRAHLICETMGSVFSQTYRPIEMIVVDDGSSDGSAEVIKRWMEKNKNDAGFTVKYIQQKNAGAPVARNKGLVESKGEYIQFLDSDDLLANRKIDTQVKLIAGYEPMTAVFGDYRRFSDLGNKILVYAKGNLIGSGNQLKEWLNGQFAASHSILWQRRDIVENGPWDEKLAVNQDGEYAMRYILKGGRFIYCSNVWSYYRYYLDSTPRMVSNITKKSSQSRFRIIHDIEQTLIERGELEEYKDVLALNYYELAEDASIFSKEIKRECLDRFNQLSPTDRIPGFFIERTARKILGVYFKKKIFHFLRYRLKIQPFKPIASVKNLDELFDFDCNSDIMKKPILRVKIM